MAMNGAQPQRRSFAAPALLLFLWRRRKSVGASIRHEFANRYSGSMLGRFWVVLFPLSFLSIYALVYTLVFRVRLPDGGTADYVLYVFSGLVPYLATMEVASHAANSVRGNLSAIRGAFLPIEILPARVAGVAMVTLTVGLVFTALLSAWTGRLSPNILLLPAVMLVQGLMLLGLASILAVLGALLRDIAHIVNLSSLAVLFLSPIAYTGQMLPPQLWFLRDLNPVFYLVDAYRTALFDAGPVDWLRLGIFTMLSAFLFIGGTAMLRRFKGVATDNA